MLLTYFSLSIKKRKTLFRLMHIFANMQTYIRKYVLPCIQKTIALLLILTISTLWQCKPEAQKANMLKVFLDTDSSKNCYTVIYPKNKEIKAYLFLLPGLGENADRVLEQSTLPFTMAEKGILTIIPTLQDGVLAFGIDSSSQLSLQKIIEDVRLKNKLTNVPFYMGGYSIGGACILKYSEDASIKPKAIFAIDPPIDFEQLYQSAKRQIRITRGLPGNEEEHFILAKIDSIMKGSPEIAYENYRLLSPYTFTDSTQRAIKHLLQTPLRLYTEPDIHWWMKERRQDYTNMNSTYHSAMINELKLLGNKNANLITTANKGFRKPENNKHPHSWSIVDQEELINWLLQFQ